MNLLFRQNFLLFRNATPPFCHCSSLGDPLFLKQKIAIFFVPSGGEGLGCTLRFAKMLKQCARHAVTLRKDTQAITHCACSHCFEHIKGVSNNRTHTFEKTKKDMLPCLWCCHHRNFAFHVLVSFNYVSLVYMVPQWIHARHFSLEKVYLEKFCMGCSQHATAQGVFCSFVLLTSGSVLLICD